MKKISIVAAILLFWFSLVAVDAAAKKREAKFYVEDIDVEAMEKEEELKAEKSIFGQYFKEKREFDEKEIDEILHKVIKSGLFEKISVYYMPEKRLLKFKVVEFPIIRSVEIKGNKKIDKEEIEKILTVKKNEFLDEKKISRDVSAIINLYHDKGFLMATVDSAIQKGEGKKKEIKIEFKIQEGSASRVKKVTIVGNKYLDESVIKSNLNTQEGGLFSYFSDGGYKKALLQEDIARIMFFYNDEGFVNVKVNPPTVLLSPDKKEIYITFVVNEGKRYKVGKLGLKGDTLDNGKPPDFKFLQKEGDWYKHSLLIRDVERIKAIYGDEGYPFVNIIPEPQFNDEDQVVDMNFDVSKGNKCKVERIDILGNERSRDKIIRREMELYEGEFYSYTAQKRSEERIRRTGFYDEVKIEIDRGSTDDMAKVSVTVVERKSGTFNVGAGFSSFESFVFNARIDQNNFLGYGQNLSLASQISKIRREVSLNFYEPYFFDYDVSFNMGFFYRYLNYDPEIYEYYADYSQDSYGFNFTFGIPFYRYFRFYAGYRLRKVEINGATEHQMNYLYRDIFSSSLEVMFSIDTRNDRMFASKGVYLLGGVEYAPRWLGSDEDILKLDFNFRWYQKLFWGIVFKTNVELGYNIHLQNRALPFSERFKLGGMYSVRGYPFYSIGPKHDGKETDYNVPTDGKDPTSSTYPYVIGGDKQFIMNNELEIPIIKQMKINFVAFLDVGNAWAKNEHFFYINSQKYNEYDLPLGLFWSAGFGIRWVTPIAPLSFEWGFPLTPRPGDPKFQFEFNIKNSF